MRGQELVQICGFCHLDRQIEIEKQGMFLFRNIYHAVNIVSLSRLCSRIHWSVGLWVLSPCLESFMICPAS